ncbi:hypothetical protein ACLOJK_005426 [Asimina triloba]
MSSASIELDGLSGNDAPRSTLRPLPKVYISSQHLGRLLPHCRGETMALRVEKSEL